MSIQRLARRAVCLIAVACGVSAVQATPTITVIPSIAPNATGSSNWNSYEANAMSALENGYSTAGVPNTPAYYSQTPSGTDLPAGAFIVTNFNSWMGNADPGTTYGAAYANEYGTRVHYGIHVVGNGTKFSASQLSFDLLYNDATYTDYNIFNVPAGSYDYMSGRVGLDYGLDGIKGTGDDVWVNSGDGTALIDEYWSRGSSLGYQVLTSDTGATNQDKIDTWIANNFGYDPYSITGRYTLGSTTGSALVTFNTPEPSSLSLLAVAGVAVLRRKPK